METRTKKYDILMYLFVLAILLYFLNSIEWKSTRFKKSMQVKKVSRIIFNLLNFRYLRLSNKLEESSSSIDNNTQDIFKKKYRIETKSCKISDLPTFDQETRNLFNHLNDPETIWKCDQKPIKIKRFNETWIRFDWTEVGFQPFCYYRRLSRGNDDFQYNFGIISFKTPR